VIAITVPDAMLMDARYALVSAGSSFTPVPSAASQIPRYVIGRAGDAARNAPKRPDGKKTGDGLTHREIQVIAGFAAGSTNAEIGRALHLSEDTVKTHARRLFRKIGARDRAHAVAIGFQRGLLGGGRS
jgi:DNA-binding NarL/FixJ family response regulator